MVANKCQLCGSPYPDMLMNNTKTCAHCELILMEATRATKAVPVVNKA